MNVNENHVKDMISELRSTGIPLKVKSRKAFGPVSPEILLEVALSISGGIPLLEKVYGIIRKHGASIECDSFYDIAVKHFRDRWPFKCVFMEGKDGNCYFLFQKGKKKFYWRVEKGKISAGDI